MAELEADSFAKKTHGPRQARRDLWCSILDAAGFDPDDLTITSFRAGTAVLRKAGYRTAFAVAEQAVLDFVERGGEVSPAFRRVIAKARRSCKRGLGPPKHSAAFPLERASELECSQDPWVPGGPMWPQHMCVVGCWWLCREIEISNVAIQDVMETAPNEISILLPASKTDIGAQGVRRSHKCACEAAPDGTKLLPRSLCPCCCLRAQLQFAQANAEDGDFSPLFPTEELEYPAKQAVIATIVQAAKKLHLPTTGHTGAPLWGGHSFRRGGAQYLAAAGVEIWRIQALARHSSGAILGYIENAHIPSLSSVAAEAAAGRSLASIREEIRAVQAALTAGKADLAALQKLVAAPRQDVVNVPISPEQVLEETPPQKSAEASQVEFVLSTLRGGKLHRVDVQLPALTICGWAWSRSARAVPSASGNGAPWCARCRPPTGLSQSSASSPSPSTSEAE